jgi:hypothetical protein
MAGLIDAYHRSLAGRVTSIELRLEEFAAAVAISPWEWAATPRGLVPWPADRVRGVIEGCAGTLGSPIVFLTPPTWRHLHNSTRKIQGQNAIVSACRGGNCFSGFSALWSPARAW